MATPEYNFEIWLENRAAMAGYTVVTVRGTGYSVKGDALIVYIDEASSLARRVFNWSKVYSIETIELLFPVPVSERAAPGKHAFDNLLSRRAWENKPDGLLVREWLLPLAKDLEIREFNALCRAVATSENLPDLAEFCHYLTTHIEKLLELRHIGRHSAERIQAAAAAYVAAQGKPTEEWEY